MRFNYEQRNQMLAEIAQALHKPGTDKERADKILTNIESMIVKWSRDENIVRDGYEAILSAIADGEMTKRTMMDMAGKAVYNQDGTDV
jgi:hypothetical protein